MIVNAILYLIFLWITGLAIVLDKLGLGDVAANNAFTAGIAAAKTYIAISYEILPLTIIALFAVPIAAMLVYEGLLGVYKLLRWAYQKIPGIN